MLLRIRNSDLLNCPVRIIKYGARRYVVPVAETSDKTKTVEYPPILDMSIKARRRRMKEEWHDKIKKLKTVEEKIYGINMPRFYGWKSFSFKEHDIKYNSLQQMQYLTRTHVMEEHNLPNFYDNIIPSEELNLMVEAIKSQIEDAIAFEHNDRVRMYELDEDTLSHKVKMDDIHANSIMYQINRAMLTSFSSKLPHLLEARVDVDPRVEAFWFMGGINVTNADINRRKGNQVFTGDPEEPIDTTIRYEGKPSIHLRHNFPLKEILPLSESENPALVVPQWKLRPTQLGYTFDRKHATNIPGFWPGDPAEFGILSYHNRGYLQNRPPRYKDEFDALAVQAILASYSWLLTQACYQGFSTFHDLTYPLTTQMVITNGQWWTFCVYQLNTLLLHSEYSDENPRRNFCWVTNPMKLYDTIENGVVRGFNEDVVKYLLKFYINAPEERTNVEMKPYLGKTVKVLADIKDDERRVWLERCYKHLVANRPKHRRIPEIYHWQQIYLINHKTKPLDKKREPFEFGINVMQRRLDDHHRLYIPRALRDNPKKRRIGRWAKTYYPDA